MQKHKAGFTVVDDTYNSNPAAVAQVLSGFGKLPWSGRRIAVLGDMLELGSSEKKRHRETGALVAKLKYDRLIAVGPLGQEMQKAAIAAGLKRDKAQWVPDALTAAEILIGEVKRGDLVIVKASHGVGLDRALAKLQEAFPVMA
ncbi:MAG: cyanophycin synthetase [Acidobacteriota bacterium]